MKRSLQGALIMNILSVQPGFAIDSVEIDTAAIKTIAESVAVLADRGRFDALEKHETQH